MSIICNFTKAYIYNVYYVLTILFITKLPKKQLTSSECAEIIEFKSSLLYQSAK